MKSTITYLLAWVTACAMASYAVAQDSSLQFPASVVAGRPFTVPTSGSGKATLYIVGPGGVLRHEVQLGQSVSFTPDEIHNAGHYTVILVGSSTQTAGLEVVPAPQPTKMSFLAKPSRLAVNQQNAISGVAYLFDEFQNLVVNPAPVSFELSEGAGAVRKQTVTARNGVAWVRLDSAPKAGKADFKVTAGDVSATRVIQQVPGEPCNLHMNARRAGNRIELQTDPLHDCSGNPVPDGTIVTFKETYDGDETTVDVPLKRGIAQTTVPAREGGVISVATGVVMGNEIRWRNGE